MRLLIASFVLIFSGCAVVPENIQVANEDQLVSYEQVVSVATEKSLNKPARWGGLIANVDNQKQGSVVEVVSFPLNNYGKPNIATESAGRFKVKMGDFLDPVVFENGRVITFTGKVAEPSEGVIGEQAYVYPTLDGESFHLWRKETQYDVSTVDFGVQSGLSPFFFGPGFYNGFYGPRFFSPQFFGPRFYGAQPFGFRNGFHRSRIRVIQRAPNASPRRNAVDTSPYKGRRSSQLDKVK